jgi:hypothetical protein
MGIIPSIDFTFYVYFLRWTFTSPVAIGTSRDNSTAVLQPMEDNRPSFRGWWDEEKKAFCDELVPLPPPDGKFNLFLTRTIVEGKLRCDYKGTRMSDGATCWMTSTWKKLPDEKI